MPKKFTYFLFSTSTLLVMILSSITYSQYRQLNQRPDRDSIVYNTTLTSNIQCNVGVQEALKSAGFDSDVPIYCVKDQYRRFNENGYSLASVRYDVGVFEDQEFDRYVTVLSKPDGSFFVFPRGFTNFYRLKLHLSEMLASPFLGLRTSFNIWKYSTISVVEKGSYYCLVHNFKFPFRGSIQQCPKMIGKHKKRRAPYALKGKVSYADNIFKWADALNLVILECNKYSNARCKSQVNLGLYNEFDYWGGEEASTAFDVSGELETIKSYLFSETIIKENGDEGMIFVKVFSDGTVKSKKIDKKAYSPYDLFRIAKQSN